jgi:hypothetical protein
MEIIRARPKAHAMDIRAKLSHLLDHWVEHNDAHLTSYRDWAAQASAGGLKDAAASLEEAIRAVESANEAMRRAKKQL